MSRSNYWCATLNNYSDADVVVITQLGANARVGYLVFGKEGANDTPHLQIYLETKIRLRFNQVKTLLGRRNHIEKRAGTAAQASDYCKKEGDWTEFGEISKPEPGHRTDLDVLHRDLRGGATIATISDEHFASFMRYRRSIESYMNIHAKQRDFKTIVRVYWGKTGTGKTRKAFEESLVAPYVHPGGNWFDGYTGQHFAIFDDFGGSEFKLTYLLKLLDRYPMKVPVKGNFVEWKPKVLTITSNIDPKDWYKHAHPEHVDALFRRIDVITEFE